MIIVETVIPPSVVSTDITLSFYTQIKVESDTFHLQYAKNSHL